MVNEKLTNLRNAMDSSTHKGRHFTDIQKAKIKHVIQAKEIVRPSKLKNYLLFAITPITIAFAAFMLTVELTKPPVNPEPSQGGTSPGMIEQDWEPRNQFVKDGEVLFTIFPDPALTATTKKSYGYMVSFTEPFETFEGKTMAIYATHKDTGMQITIRPPKLITESSPGYDSLQRFTFEANTPLSGYWKYKVVLDGEVYGDVILYIPENQEEEAPEYLLDPNLELVDYNFEDLAAELKNKGIEHKLPSKLPVEIINYEIIEGDPNNPYAPKDISIVLNGENGEIFTVRSGIIDLPELFFSTQVNMKEEEVSISGHKGLYIEGYMLKWLEEEEIAYTFTSSKLLSKETMIQVGESFK
ncbi:hypothetical protein [Bacillus sp. AK128]